MQVRIATFNAENLFARFKFKGKRVRGGYRKWTDAEVAKIASEGWGVSSTMYEKYTSTARRLTGAAIVETRADIIGLQEVENMDTLKRFDIDQLGARDYRHKVVIDGNDQRFIDVALMTGKRFEIDYVKTHQYLRRRSSSVSIFSRDCLEVGVAMSGGGPRRVLPVFVNYFTSMMRGRQNTMRRRKEQSEALVKILHDRFGSDPGGKERVVMGDLNDYLPSPGLNPLLSQPWLENVMDRLDEDEQWTHYWDDKDQYRTLDYILVSRTLAQRNRNSKLEIIRKGMPKRAAKYTGRRFDGVGKNRPKASDHCPVVIALDVKGNATPSIG